MPLTNFPFTNPINYTKVNTEVDGGKGKLTFTDNTGQLFNEDFADDTGFIFDAAKAEFSGGLIRQIDTTPTDTTFFAAFGSTLNASWADGPTATIREEGTVSAAGGRLNLKGTSGLNFVDWDASGGNANGMIQTGTIRVNFIPDYSGSPAASQLIVDIGNDGGNVNRVVFFHQTDGRVGFNIYDSSGTLIDNTIGAVFVAVAGQSYEFEMDFDVTVGQTKVFIDGVQSGATLTNTGTRSSAITVIRTGSSMNQVAVSPDYELDNLLLFDTVQHVGNYTPGAAPAPTRFEESVVELPIFTYPGLGQLQALESLATTQVGIPKYHIEVNGVDKYWDGAAWVTSDGTYLQSSTQTDFSTNAPTLTVLGEPTLKVKAVFQDTQTLQSIDDLTLRYTGQIFNTTGTLVTDSAFTTGEISAFSAVLTEPGTDLTKFAFNVDAVNRYFDGAVWAVSDLSESQTNTLAEIQANFSTLLSQTSLVKVVVFLKSNAVSVSTPDIDSIDITHGIGTSTVVAPQTCSVFGFLLDPFGVPIGNATIEFTLAAEDKEYAEAANNVIQKVSASVLTDSFDGAFTKDLIRSSEFEGEGRYVLKVTDSNGKKIQFVDGDRIVFTVPDQASANITSLITQV